MSRHAITLNISVTFTNILVTVTPVLLIRCKSKTNLKTATTTASHCIFCTAVFQTVKYLQGKFN